MKAKHARIITCASAIALATAYGADWDFTGGKTPADWFTFGTVKSSALGMTCGPHGGAYAPSGIRSGPQTAGGGIRVHATLGGLMVQTAAPDNLENRNDIYVHVAIGGSPALVWESDKAVVDFTLFFNSEHDGLYVGLYGKGPGRPNTGPDQLVRGDFLGEGSGQGEIVVELDITAEKATARITTSSGVARHFEAPLPQEIKPLLTDPYYVQIYQQNVGAEGTGSVEVRKISIR